MGKRLPAAAISILLISCDAHTSIEGRVRDRSGNPVEGALAELKPGQEGIWQDTSSKLGEFRLARVHGLGTGRFTLSISKAGYKPFSVDVEPHQNYTCQVMLSAMAEMEASTGACQPRRPTSSGR